MKAKGAGAGFSPATPHHRTCGPRIRRFIVDPNDLATVQTACSRFTVASALLNDVVPIGSHGHNEQARPCCYLNTMFSLSLCIVLSTMHKHKIIFLSVMMYGLAVVACRTQEANPLSNDDVAAIKNATESYDQAARTNDWANWAAHFTENGWSCRQTGLPCKAERRF